MRPRRALMAQQTRRHRAGRAPPFVQFDAGLGDSKLSGGRGPGSVLMVHTDGTFDPLHIAAQVVHYA